jgi:S-adenosylmethionine decarboxylase
MAAMQGLHLTADLHGCDPLTPAMRDADALQRLCRQAVEAAGLCAVADLFHRFSTTHDPTSGGGVTGVLLLAESHLAVHTWPELGAVTVDIYVCNRRRDNSAAAQLALAAVIDGFAPGTVERHVLHRGTRSPPPRDIGQ